MSEIAVQGCTVKASLDTGKGTIETTPQITTIPSAKDFVISGSDKGIYFEKVSVLIPSGTVVTLTSTPSGASSPISQPLAVANSIDINGTANNVLDGNNKKALQKGDKGSKGIEFMFLDTSNPPAYTIPYSVNVNVEITNAGQTKIEAL